MTLEQDNGPVEILLVEDNPGDVELTQRILGNSKFSVNVTIAPDGEEAMAHLRRKGKHAKATRPELVLLDLAMPKKDGYEVLEEMSADPKLRDVPVMVLTSTQADRARLSSLYSYDLSPPRQMLGLFQKPIDLPRFDTLISRLRSAQVETPTAPDQLDPQVAVQTEQRRRRWWPLGKR